MVWLHRIALNPMANLSLPKNGRKVLSGSMGSYLSEHYCKTVSPHASLELSQLNIIFIDPIFT